MVLGLAPLESSRLTKSPIKYLLLDHMKAVSPEIFSVDGVFAENGKSICEGNTAIYYPYYTNEVIVTKH
jgi:hypothetical protein